MTEQQAKEIAWAAWQSAANAYRMYPNNNHTFTDYWDNLGKDNFSKMPPPESLQAGKGMRWVKASEKPKTDGWYITDAGTVQFRDGLWRNGEFRETQNMKVSKWLDEQSTQSMQAYTPTVKEQGERFKMPTDKDIIDFALIFNDGKIEREKLSDMVAMCQFIVDRLFENGDIKIPSSKENK
jgi:hypothetical protein